MAIFGKKEEKKDAGDARALASKEGAETTNHKTPKEEVSLVGGLWEKRRGSGKIQAILRKPRVTEKTSILASRGVYTFEVAPEIGKGEATKAFQKIYGKKPARVSVMNTRGKKKRTRFGVGTTNRKKKVLFYLKRGETIDFV